MKKILFSSDGGRRGGSSLSGLGLSSLSEPIVELAVDHLQVAKTSGSGGATTDGLLRPLISSLPRVTTGSTFMLLNVIGTASTSPAQCMSLIVLLSEASRTLRHLTISLKLSPFKQIETTQL